MDQSNWTRLTKQPSGDSPRNEAPGNFMVSGRSFHTDQSRIPHSESEGTLLKFTRDQLDRPQSPFFVQEDKKSASSALRKTPLRTLQPSSCDFKSSPTTVPEYDLRAKSMHPKHPSCTSNPAAIRKKKTREEEHMVPWSKKPLSGKAFPFSPIFLPSESDAIVVRRRAGSLSSLISSSSASCASSNEANRTSDEQNKKQASSSSFSSSSPSHRKIHCNSSNNLYKLCISRTSIGSIESQITCCSSCSCTARPKNPKTAAFIVTSSVYGQLLVVICLAFFTAKTTTSQIPLIYFEGFYLYLYAISLIFLAYVYVYLLHDLPTPESRNKDDAGIRKTKGKISDSEKSHGSIFLRIGAIAFGLGTMIYNGIEFGSFFETPRTSPCYSVLLGVNPVLQATFTFAQMYFIFTYSRLMIHKFKLVARLGLMHLVATNICTWIRTLGKETVQEFQSLISRKNDSIAHELGGLSSSPFNSSVQCQTEDIMAGILKSVSPYLYPFIVEYSLIGAAFLYIMWSNIGRGMHRCNILPVNGTSPGSPRTILSTAGSPVDHTLSPGFANDNLSTSSSRSNAGSNHSLYSCLGSSKGLFSGFLFLVVSITSLIIFFVLIHHPSRQLSELATLISEGSHSCLLVFCCLATLAAHIRIRNLKFMPGLNETADSGLRDILLKVAAFGLYSYSLFGVIAGAINPYSFKHLAVLVSSSLTIVQVTLQSLFISDVVCRRRNSLKEPARQLITFLLITNFTLWIIYTFEMQKIEASPVQLSLYGHTTWTLIVRITLPLSIFYRFHSAITFAEVWKNSYK